MASADEIRTPIERPPQDRAAPPASTPPQAATNAISEVSGGGSSEVASTGTREGDFARTILYLLIGYLILAKGRSLWKEEEGGLLGFAWAFVWSYGLLLFGVPLLVFLWRSLHAKHRRRGVSAVALVLGPLALWYWVGAYNRMRDILIAIVVGALVMATRKRGFRLCRDALRKVQPAVEKKLDGARGTPSFAMYKPLLAIFRKTRAALALHGWRHCFAVVAWLAITWVLGSAADAYLGTNWTSLSKPLQVTPDRFIELAKVRPTERDAGAAEAAAPPLRLGVSLSGGGFRAALMHAGVLAALEELRTPIAGLATVSGGSIIGGFYVLGGRPTDFRDAVADGRFNATRDLVDAQNLLRLPCPGHVPLVDMEVLWWCAHSRVDVQANLLDRVLFDGKRVTHLERDRQRDGDWWTKPPWWVIGVTDLLRGEAIGISADGVFRRAHATPGRGLHREQLHRDPSSVRFHNVSSARDIRDRRVAELVTMSGAFPGAFGSSDLEIVGGTRFQVVDGGVTDNLGYSLFASALEESKWRSAELASGLDNDGKKWEFDLIIVSDGGMPLSEEKTMPAHMEFIRAMDVVYASAGIAVPANAVQKIWLSPLTIPIVSLSEEDLRLIPEKLRRGRTLDEFKRDLRRARDTFLVTTTLKDRFDPRPHERMRRLFKSDPELAGRDAVDALFELGQCLVYLSSCDIGSGLALQIPGCKPVTGTLAVSAR